MEVVPRPLKILQMVSGTDVNGALMHCKLLSRQLALRGHEVTIACRKNSWLWSQTDDSRVRLVTCEMSRWPFSDVRKFAAWVRREQFDVLHTHMSSAHLFGVIVRRLAGIPVVATAHSRHIQPHWHLNDRVIANSEATRRYHRRFNLLNPHRIETVHCFIDNRKFREPEPVIKRALRRQWRFSPEARVLVIAGDVVPHKGHRFLFRSLPELVRRFDDLRVVVVGRFNRRETCTKRLRRFQFRNGLEKRVRWIGRRNNMHEMLAAGDVVVVPSIVESLGLIALESMAVGTPVVASRTGGLVELVDHEQNGLLVPARNPRALTAAVSRLLEDHELRTRLIESGKQKVARQFSPESLTARVEGILTRVAAPPPPGSGRGSRHLGRAVETD